MDNYEYIIASLPVIRQEERNSSDLDVEGLQAMIAEQLSERDRKVYGMLLDGFDGDNLNEEFYRKALSSPNAFMRDYFTYDMHVRNTKVEYLNKALGRPEGTDILILDEDGTNEFDGKEEVQEVLSQDDILSRERGLDDLMWRHCEDLTRMHVFDLDVILSFTARLRIIDRWLKLDPGTGRELFRKLVNEIRNSNK